MEFTSYDRQQELEKAMALNEKENKEEAIALYRNIIKQSPDWSTPLYNLGLIHKYACEWQQSYDCNKRAVALSPDDEAAWWNLGIAATALFDWKTARQAWNHFGLKLEVNSEELNMDLGRVPVRVSVDDAPEVVWTTRICPARAVIQSVPFAESGRRYKDLVLNDGAPAGYRMVGGREIPVFNELQLLRASDNKTFSVNLPTTDQEQIGLLSKMCEQFGIGFEDWSTVRMLCKQCSEGTPHEDHDHDLQHNAGDTRIVGLSFPDQQKVVSILDAWRKGTGLKYSSLVVELD